MKFDSPEFQKFRHPNGVFKHWLHTWRYSRLQGLNSAFPVTQYTEYWAPLPWLWHEEPDGETLTAMYHIGYLKLCPGAWPTWTPAARGPYTVYGKLLPRIQVAPWDNFPWDAYVLFNPPKPKEM